MRAPGTLTGWRRGIPKREMTIARTRRSFIVYALHLPARPPFANLGENPVLRLDRRSPSSSALGIPIRLATGEERGKNERERRRKEEKGGERRERRREANQVSKLRRQSQNTNRVQRERERGRGESGKEYATIDANPRFTAYFSSNKRSCLENRVYREKPISNGKTERR